MNGQALRVLIHMYTFFFNSSFFTITFMVLNVNANKMFVLTKII